jgi:polysaccharide export outer membrane protein
MIRLPLLKRQVKAVGLLPSEVETALVGALKSEDILVDPVVTVSVIQYRSRPINVAGAVKAPVTFQASGTVTLLDALARAGGISESAGPEILVTRSGANRESGQDQVTERIPVQQLIAGNDPKLNIRLEGGEDIRVPEAGLVYVVGSFRKPGVFKIQHDSALSVMEALALAEGLTPYAMKNAYIFRQSGPGRKEIPVQLNKIMGRTAPDVSLQANDIFYVPDNKSRRNLSNALDKAIILTGSLGAAALYSVR